MVGPSFVARQFSILLKSPLEEREIRAESLVGKQQKLSAVSGGGQLGREEGLCSDQL